MARGRQVIPVAITFSTLACGVLAILLALEGMVTMAGGFILLGYLLDALDGELARSLQANSPFGLELDSIVDEIYSGVAPGVLVIQHVRGGTLGGWPAWVAGIAFAMAGAYRLARFNLGAGAGKSGQTIGLTISTSGALVATTVLTDLAYIERIFPDWFFLVVLALLSGLMVSRIRFLDLRSVFGNRWVNVTVFSTTVGLAIWLSPQAASFMALLGYVVFGVLRAGARLF